MIKLKMMSNNQQTLRKSMSNCTLFYHSLLPSSAQLDLSQHVELFGLPLPSEHAMAKQNNNLKEMFCEGNLTLDDVQQLARFTAAIVQAHANNIKVNDENMEPLVVSLPEIEMLA